MKEFRKHLFIILIVLLSTAGLYAQETDQKDKYYEKMQSSLFTLYKAGNFETFNMMSKQLRKIAEEEETKWIPYYHSCYAYTMAAFLGKEKFTTEELVNEAQNMLDKANKLSPNNDEIVALQGFIYQARMINKEGKQVHTWAQKSVMEYDHARFLNPENPRPYYLIGQMLYRLPPGFGGNKESACKHFIQAEEKYNTFKPKSSFSPNWGEEANTKMLHNCK